MGSRPINQHMNESNQFLLYTVPDGAVKVDVFVKDETVWLTQATLGWRTQPPRG